MVDMKNRDSIIRMFHVHKRYGSKHALKDISFDIERNDFVFITGASGAGKSTLLRLLYRGEPVSEGQILIDGMNLSRINRKKIPLLRRNFGIVFQDFKLIPTKTVFDNVAIVLEAAGVRKRMILKKVNSVLRITGMDKKHNSYPPGLSGGEQQRVAVARAVVGDPKIILADEPTGSLDSESACIVVDLLKNFNIRGATVIIATHDQELIRKTEGRIVVLKDGCIHQEIGHK